MCGPHVLKVAHERSNLVDNVETLPKGPDGIVDIPLCRPVVAIQPLGKLRS